MNPNNNNFVSNTTFAPVTTANPVPGSAGYGKSTATPVYAPSGPAVGNTQINTFSPLTSPSQTTNASQLGQNAFNLPPATSNTISSGVSGLADGSLANHDTATQLAQQEADRVASAKTDTNTGNNAIQNILAKIMGEPQKQDDFNAQYGVNDKQKLADDAYAALNASKQAQMKEIDAIKSSSIAGNAGATANAIQAINDKYAYKQADLSISLDSANRYLTSAQNAVDAKMKLLTQNDAQQLQVTEYFQNHNWDDLSKAEQNQLETQKAALKQSIDDKQAAGDALKSLLATGQHVTADQVNQITSAKNGAEAYAKIAAMGFALNNPLDDQLKRSEIAKNVAAAQQAVNSLPPATQTRVQTIAGQFDAEQAVKNYQTIAETIDAVKGAGSSPTDDIQRVYAFAKIMDPNSAVREGEYKTVQDYSAAVLQRTGIKAKRIFSNTGFLTDEARTFMNTTLDNRLASSEKAYENIYKSYGDRINKVTGKTDGTDYITDYSAPFKSAAPSSSSNTTKSGKTFDVEGAKLQGYTEEEIKDYLNTH